MKQIKAVDTELGKLSEEMHKYGVSQFCRVFKFYYLHAAQDRRDRENDANSRAADRRDQAPDEQRRRRRFLAVLPRNRNPQHPTVRRSRTQSPGGAQAEEIGVPEADQQDHQQPGVREESRHAE
jgi:hypothetical protein